MRAYSVKKRTLPKKHKDGTPYVWESKTYYLSYYRNRKKIQENTGYSEKALADIWAEERMKHVDSITLKDFLENNGWFSETENPLYKDANSGIIKYNYMLGQSQKNTRYLEIIIKDIEDPIGDLPYNAINKVEADKFRERLLKMSYYIDGKGNKREVTTTFRNRVILSLSVVFNYYIRFKRQYFGVNPFEKFATPKTQESKEKYVFSPKQINYMFKAYILERISPCSLVNGYKREPTLLTQERWLTLIHSIYFRLFKFIAYTGLRSNEACALTVGQFDKSFNNRVVYINRAYKAGVTSVYAKEKGNVITVVGAPKSGKARTIVLCDEAYFAVADLLDGKDDDCLVFSTRPNGKEIADSLYSNTKNHNFRIFINEIQKQFKIQTKNNEELTLHGFRTTLNSNLLNKTTLRESLIAAYLGWESKSLTSTQRKHYTHYDVDHLWEVASAINELYSNEPIRWTPHKEETEDLELENIVNSLISPDCFSRQTAQNMFRQILVEVQSDISNKRYRKEMNKESERYYDDIRAELNSKGLPELDISDMLILKSDPFSYKYAEEQINKLINTPVNNLSDEDYKWLRSQGAISFIINQNPERAKRFTDLESKLPHIEKDDLDFDFDDEE